MEKGRWKDAVLSHTRAYGDVDRGATGLGGTSPRGVPRGPLFRRLSHQEVQPSLCAEGGHPSPARGLQPHP